MDQQSTATSPANGASTAHDLFALTDEQILEIEPENATAALPASEAHPQSVIPSERSESRDRGNIIESPSSQNPSRDSSASSRSSTGTPVGMTDGKASENVAGEPPQWLAAQMKDPWSGEEAKELWNGVQQARQEAAAYRAAFATPEDARALKELYPGGVSEARATAERAKLLDQIDGAYFGAAGSSAEQTSASRAQLAAILLREDPGAFREMVFAGLRALENGAGVGATLGSPSADGGGQPAGGASPAPTAIALAGATFPSPLVGAQHAAPLLGNTSANEAHVAAYAAFEKAANEDLERSVGGTIVRTIEQALPNLKKGDEKREVGARYIVPLHERLGTAVRQDIEAALRSDRQLGEQIAQILSARRFDGESRAQVVRLIGERAQQLVPGAAKRVLNDWTQTTLAAHRTQSARADAASARREVAPAFLPAGLPRDARSQTGPDLNRGAARHDTRRVDYRKLSDEQILEL